MATTLSHYRGFNFLLGRREVGAGRTESLAPFSIAVTHTGREQPSMEMGQQHLPTVLWADSQAYQGADPALGGQHRLEDGVLLLLWPMCEACPTSYRKAGWVGRAPGLTHRSST